MVEIDSTVGQSNTKEIPADVEEKRQNEHKRRIRIGYMMALFCALFWGMWYVPGNALWVLNPFDDMMAAIAVTNDETIGLLVTAILITAFNAITVVIALFIWNGALGRLGELKRTILEWKPCGKYYFFGAIFGGPIAILGSFIAMGFIGGAFAAVASLMFPVIGAILSSRMGQQVSRRAYIGIFMIIAGGVTLYAGGLLDDLSRGDLPIWGYIGGLMAATGWGIEGAVASKALDVSSADVGLHIRFIAEVLIWMVIALPLLTLAGFPMFDYAAMIFSQPITMVTLMMAGITFGFCYVTWYKSFVLVGVGRGQGMGIMAGLFCVLFLFLFTGAVPTWTVAVGAILTVAGGVYMFTEESTALQSIRKEECIEGKADQSKETRKPLTKPSNISKKSEDRPIKFRILEIFSDEEARWSGDVIRQVMSDYGMSSNYDRENVNFYLVELAAGGMLKEIDVKIDDEGSYKKGALLHKYRITDFGRTRAEGSCFT